MTDIAPTPFRPLRPGEFQQGEPCDQAIDQTQATMTPEPSTPLSLPSRVIHVSFY